ncbi:MAG TPA: CbtB-domain containing protein [Pilimelia sp.]|nr:CbtB-domain containing protein [Pilimelia sp.]
MTSPSLPVDARPEALRLPWWAALVTLAALLTVYAVSQENGALLSSAAGTVHEFFHNGRHALGVPCH